MKSQSKSLGFTIVELLIVIVVIGILAAITIVSYQGIRVRAYNTQIVNGVQQYRTAIESYRAAIGTYPQTSREQAGQSIAMACLGSGYAGQYCGKVTNVGTYEDSVFNQQLNTFLQSTPPSISGQSITVASENFTGAVYGNDQTSYSSTGYARTIQYALLGKNANCVISGAYAYNTTAGTTACELLIQEVP